MAKTPIDCNLETRIPLNNEIEKEITTTFPSDDNVKQEDVVASPQASGDRAVVLMDLDNGLVGWESIDDPANPQQVDQPSDWAI